MAVVLITLQGCGKVYPIFHGNTPSRVKVEKLDMTGAAALAIMPYSGATKAMTKADAETGDVSLTGLSEYSGPVIKSYYRLN